MNINLLYYIIAICIAIQFLYYTYKFYIEYRASRILEQKLKAHRHIYEQYRRRYAKKNTADIPDYETEILLKFLREEINKLENEKDKTALRKTLNQKNFQNQKRFAVKLMEESGLANSLPAEY